MLLSFARLPFVFLLKLRARHEDRSFRSKDVEPRRLDGGSVSRWHLGVA